MTLKGISLGAATAVLVAAAASATPILIGGTEYVRSGSSEIGIAASFGPSGSAVSTSTTFSYSGFVEVIVRGTGSSLGSCVNDAFFVLSCPAGFPAPPTPFHDGSYYQLALDTIPITGSPGLATPAAQLATRSIRFDVDASVETAAPYVPALQGSNTYNFVVELSLTGGFGGGPSTLNFGVADGIYSDNTGAFSIDVYQLEPVPEPGTLLLLGSGLTALVARRRRQA